MNSIPIDKEIYLSRYSENDIPVVTEYLNDLDVYRNLLTAPHPYEEKHAIAWIEKNAKTEEERGHPVSWALRNKASELMGGLGAKFDDLETFHRLEIGYWLGKPFWGKGIMSHAVGGYCHHLFETFTVRKITAHVFRENEASLCVLRKNGFREEGLLRKHFFKDGDYIDAYIYGLLKEDLKL